MRPTIEFTEDHELFREAAREFITHEVAAHYPQWEREHMMPRTVWTAAGEAGLLGLAVPEEYGGAGMPDYRYQLVLTQELAAKRVPRVRSCRAPAAGLGTALPSGIRYQGAEAAVASGDGHR